MSYRRGNRYQGFLFPQYIDDLVPEDATVRVYDFIVSKIDLRGMGIEINEKKVGNPAYDPQVMVTLILYSYSEGIRSSRDIEEACRLRNDFVWLMGGLVPDHKTIAEFIRKNKKALKNIMKEVVRICKQMNLVSGDTIFIDGSKFKGNASMDREVSADELREYLAYAEKQIEGLIDETERLDNEETEVGLRHRLPRGIKVEDVEKLIDRLTEDEKERINITDPDSRRMKSRQGYITGYNAQIAVDDEHGLIVAYDVVSENNDLHQLGNMVEKVEEMLGKRCERVCADSGYSNTKIIKEVMEKGIDVIVPTPKQVMARKEMEFDKDRFRYVKEEDCYICPAGERMYYSYTRTDGKRVYRFRSEKICKSCKYYGSCTSAKRGRTIGRLEYEEIKEVVENRYLEDDAQKIYQRRQGKVEHPFGYIKHNLGVRMLLQRGIEGVKAEIAILLSCFNIRRLITIFGGTKNLIDRLVMIS